MRDLIYKISEEAFKDELQKIAEEAEESGSSDINKINKLLPDFLLSKKDGDINDDNMHSWAKKNKLNINAVEAEVYKLAIKYNNMLHEGKGPEAKKTWKDVNPDQLQMGIKVEMEHTGDPELARKISVDHLTEFSNYYTALDEMENKLKAGKK